MSCGSHNTGSRPIRNLYRGYSDRNELVEQYVSQALAKHKSSSAEASSGSEVPRSPTDRFAGVFQEQDAEFSSAMSDALVPIELTQANDTAGPPAQGHSSELGRCPSSS